MGAKVSGIELHELRRTKAANRFKQRIRELTGLTRGVSTEQMAEELARYLRGWIGYFGKCETPSVLEHLEKWVRHRLRSVIWKRWKRGTIRFAELRKRGVHRQLAAKTAGGSYGPWLLSHIAGRSMWPCPSAYFHSLGLPRLTGGR